MKKLLAMVMALVMTMSLVSLASAKKLSDYSDSEKVTSTYEAAVDLMTQAGVIAGYPDGTFKPQNNVTRAEMAKMICYSLLGADQAEKLGVSRQIFSDVPTSFWGAKYIEYCYSQGIIGGYGNDKYGPNDPVTGYQAAKMILVTKGYSKAGAYQGTGWQVAVAADAMKDILAGSKTASYEKPATREEVAYYMFNGFTTPSVQYVAMLDIYMGTDNFVLGEKDTSAVMYNEDNYGRPEKIYSLTTNAGKTYKHTEKLVPVQTYKVGVTECDLTNALDKTTKADLSIDKIYVNNENTESDTTIGRYNVNDYVGAQGVLTEVYKVAANKWAIIEIDTYLAKVVKIYDAIKDSNNCVIVPAYTEFEMYMWNDQTDEMETYSVFKITDQFAKGSYVLINGMLNKKTPEKTYNSIDLNERTGFTPVDVKAATPVSGKATQINFNNYPAYDACIGSLVIGGTAIPMAEQYNLGFMANLGTTYNFFYDSYGNVIGNVLPGEGAKTYGIITALAYEHAGLSRSYVDANVVTFGGEKLDAIVINKLNDAKISNTDNAGEYGSVQENTASSNSEFNGDYYYQNYFFQYSKNSSGSYDLTSVDVYELDGVKITKGNPIVTDGEKTFVFDGKTQFLVVSGSAAKGYTYTPVSGYLNLDTMSGVKVYCIESEEYVQGDADLAKNRASYVVIDISSAIYAGDTINPAVMLPSDVAPISVTSKTATYKFYVNGAAQAYVFTNDTVVVDTDGNDVVIDNQHVGYWKLELNKDKEVLKATYLGSSETLKKEILTVGKTVLGTTTVITDTDGKNYNVSSAKLYEIVESPYQHGYFYVREGKLADLKAGDEIVLFVAKDGYTATSIYYASTII